MWGPGDSAHGVFMAEEFGQGAVTRETHVECPDGFVDACDGEGVFVVLVPVLGEKLAGGGRRDGDRSCWDRWRAGVEEADGRVGGDGGDRGGGVRGEESAVGARVNGEGEE